MDQNFKVNVDESFEYDLKNSDIKELDVLECFQEVAVKKKL